MSGLVTIFELLCTAIVGISFAWVFDRWVQRRRDVHTARTRPVPRSVAAQFAPTRLDAEMARALRQARLNRATEYDPAAMDSMLNDVERSAS